uniref:Sodium/nucleoside cotransporter n=1 Tax=Plectus sambesii TaxID=2011161 RepID=A0A914WR89_9BILA
MDGLQRVYDSFQSLQKQYGPAAIKVLLAALILALHIFLGLAIVHNFKLSVALLCFMSIGWLAAIYYFLLNPALDHFSPQIDALSASIRQLWKRTVVRGVVYIALCAAFVVFLMIITSGSWIRKVSIGGLLFYIIVSIFLSNNPSRIKWRPVVWGVLLQFVAGLLVLRWSVGQVAFKFTSEQLVRFLEYTSNGTNFVFGFVANPPIICGMDAPFSFSSLPIIIYFGAITSVLFHYGVIQFILVRVAWLMQYTMGTTAAESLNAAACIFIGPTEAAVLMRFALPLMTSSELMAALTCGFSSISGSLFAAYISFGACPNYLLAANVMSAPALLAVSKIMHPETQKSRQKDMTTFKLPKGSETSALECLSNGAVQAVWFIFAIIASLIVFLALLALLDSIIGTLGGMVGYHDLTFN